MKISFSKIKTKTWKAKENLKKIYKKRVLLDAGFQNFHLFSMFFYIFYDLVHFYIGMFQVLNFLVFSILFFIFHFFFYFLGFPSSINF
jgi:hypothetical protein